ncbi:hypothetical protein LMG23994_06224 [Cupriavidus pinatubonensis]|uniref:HTH lysR-type domain-containing protein n=1 Tax=Cupriavidus pinatubonensis TaxID=248026 RepID=A0ABN7ZQL7_9BURK|nr:hypothetical protein LMG23994_06224 [Cupriavidus pinatubonensis]
MTSALNSDDLACFVCVANAQSISRAAPELGADQSTVSRQIARLEAALDTRLFHRSGRGVVLTTARNRAVVPELWDIVQTVRQSVRSIVTSGAWPGARLV